MTPRIDLSVSCADWRTDLRDLEGLARETVLATLQAAAPADWQDRVLEVHLDFMDDHRQRQLNRDYRGLDRTTNVLAFANLEGEDGLDLMALPKEMPILLGDVTLAHGQMVTEARAQQKPLAHHARHLIVHGVLHLLGHDHEDTGAAVTMEAQEVAILADLGIADPYRETSEISTNDLAGQIDCRPKRKAT